MTARPLDFAFAAMSPLSERLPISIERDEQLLELEDELGRRAHAYPRLVSEGRLGRDEAERHLALWRHLVEEARIDVAAARDGSWRGLEQRREASRLAPYRWPDKVREIRRELALRRNTLPRLVGQRRLTADLARQRLERLDGLHWFYWIGLGFLDADFDLATQEGYTAFRVVARGLGAQADEWLLQAGSSGERVAVGEAARIADQDRATAEALARPICDIVEWRRQDIARLATLRPDLMPAVPIEKEAA